MAVPIITEVRRRTDPDLPLWQHPGWTERFPWLVQGVTGAGEGAPFDLALFGESPSRTVMDRWSALGRATGLARIVHARQVHGAVVRVHQAAAPGLTLVADTDGHVTRAAGLLLTVSVADCVPVSLVDPERRAIALLHAGWRGAAGGILERGIETLVGRLNGRVGDLHVHLGPAICGTCYEVGPEVHRGLGLPDPGRPLRIDLRAELARRAVAAGVPASSVTVSSHCTKCGGGSFFSHRAGRAERQVAVLGMLPG